jgi:hypothetical protein
MCTAWLTFSVLKEDEEGQGHDSVGRLMAVQSTALLFAAPSPFLLLYRSIVMLASECYVGQLRGGADGQRADGDR